MGLSLLSILEIQGNEVRVETYSNKEKTDYGFVVYRMRDGEIHKPIVSTIPNFPYKSDEEASSKGNALVEDIRNRDLTPERSHLQKIMGPETSEMVSKIVRAANQRP